LVKFILKKAPNKGGKGGQKETTQVQAKNAQTQKGCHKGAKMHKPKRGVTRGQRNTLCSKALTSHKKHIKERKEGKLESIISF
jgi:hypothetical protein